MMMICRPIQNNDGILWATGTLYQQGIFPYLNLSWSFAKELT